MCQYELQVVVCNCERNQVNNWLILGGCESIRDEDIIVNLTTLYCNGCGNIRNVERQVNLKELYCRGCPTITNEIIEEMRNRNVNVTN